ncbi:MAG: aspartyl/glutamyl-tRNA(Asn/Gln) amidotransferase, C subunit [Parcubacteria bacterium C7867-001]|nr:MAG: aspartyl/glutamyl-tRNA(Asn/Gln) amidotransferase, C subunit [Parcubacteria bacterium C7867-001]
MASADDVKKLAALARITLSEEEIDTFTKEFEGILAYVGQIESLSVTPEVNRAPAVRNVFREDGEPHEKGKYTEKLAAQFPERDGQYLKVKQIISHD